MAYSIKDPETDRVIRELARAKGKPILDSIREACQNELLREREKISLWDRLQPLINRVAQAPKAGSKRSRFYAKSFGDPK
ncbi:MAG: type II toxin-antitoxin system VapB family antitoxin [Methylocystis sp.]